MIMRILQWWGCLLGVHNDVESFAQSDIDQVFTFTRCPHCGTTLSTVRSGRLMPEESEPQL